MRSRVSSVLFALSFLLSTTFAGSSAAISGPRVVAIASAPHAIAVADLNGDGIPDLVVAGSQGQLQIILHNADESFQTSAIYHIPDALTALVVLPPAATAKAGLALASASGKVYFLPGNGDGTFGASSAPVAVSSSLVSLALADPNAAGYCGVFALDKNGIAYLVDPDTLVARAVATIPGATRFVSADFDQDGFVDLAFASPTGLSVAFGTGAGAFTSPVTLPGVDAPVTLAAADLDGHGIRALIASDAAGKLTFLNPVKRQFQISAHLETAAPEFAAADLDHDGQADLVVSNTAEHAVAFYRGLGLGQFANAVQFGAGSPMTALAASAGMAGLVSDRSGAVAVMSTGIAAVSPSSPASAGTPSGTSAGSGTKPAGAAPAAATTVTLTSSPNPGKLATAIAFTATVTPPTATGKVTFYDGSAVIGISPVSGGTATLATVSLPAGKHSVTARYDGDPNNLSSVSAPYIQSVTDFAALGFASPLSIAAGPEPGTVVTGDFNKDGKLDIVALTTDPNTGAGSAVFIPGTGFGTFGTPLQIPINQYPFGAVVADFNGDGNLDLGITAGNLGGSNTVTPEFDVLLGNGNGTFQPYRANQIPYLSSSPLIPPDGLAAGDFNRDGIVDVVTANDLDNSIAVFLGNGDGTFQAGARYSVCTNCTSGTPTGQNPVAVAIADFNRDGIPDIATANSNDGTVSILLGTGSGTFNLLNPFPISTGSHSTAVPQEIAAFDTNGDGIPDLVITDAANAVVIVLNGLGNGTFAAPQTYAVGNSPAGLAAADFNGDLITDLVVTNSSDNTFSILLGSPTGGFTAGLTVGGCVGNCYWLQPAVGDFNQDSISDVVIADAGDLGTSQPDPYPGLVDVFLGQGCSFNINPNTIAFDNRGGTEQVLITAPASNCTWTASSGVPWVSVTPSVGEANATPLTVIVQANNTGADLMTNITVAGQSVPVVSRFTQTVFGDVAPSNIFFDEINAFYAKGITAGCSINPLDYCPDSSITRAQMAVFIVRAVYGGDNFTLNQTAPYFNDVPPGSFGYNWIQKMYELGITTGCSANPLDFCPGSYVTRDNMAAFLIRMRFEMAPFTYPPSAYFTDVPATDPFFEYVQRLAYDQITTGCQLDLYCPADNVTRGQMAVFIMRAQYNEFLAPGTPVIASVSPAPAVLAPGTTGTFSLTGLNTNFQQGITQLVPPPGVTVSSLTVNSPTSLTVALTAAASGVAAQPEPFYIETGTEQAVLPNSLIVQ